MITAYSMLNGAVRRSDLSGGVPPPPDAVWIDLLDPTQEERLSVESSAGVVLPSHEEMHELELSSRLYLEQGATYMTADFVVLGPKRPEVHAVTFVLTKKQLITVRFKDIEAFATFQSHFSSEMLASGDAVLLGLFESTIAHGGQLLRKLTADLEQVGQVIFWDAATDEDRAIRKNIGLKHALSGLGHAGELASKVQQELLSLDRLLSFYAEGMKPKAGSVGAMRMLTLQRDVMSLIEHAEFLSQKASFLLDATLGFINAEQNQIIKLFSVAAVVFLPPTLIASIYGMNFDVMPELAWPFGYPFAILLMLIAAIGPYFFFKKKGWI